MDDKSESAPTVLASSSNAVEAADEEGLMVPQEKSIGTPPLWKKTHVADRKLLKEKNGNECGSFGTNGVTSGGCLGHGQRIEVRDSEFSKPRVYRVTRRNPVKGEATDSPAIGGWRREEEGGGGVSKSAGVHPLNRLLNKPAK